MASTIIRKILLAILCISTLALFFVVRVVMYQWYRISNKGYLIHEPTNHFSVPLDRCKRFNDFNLTVCIHDPETDIYVSKKISQGVLWEGHLIKIIQDMIKEDRSLALIDIGANIGCYSLAAAGVGSRALAVEPMPHNLELLHASIALSHLQDVITVVPYAVSDGYYNMSLETAVTNQGRSLLKKADECIPSDKYTCTYTTTIKLDDLLKGTVYMSAHLINM